jgi:predicted RNA-binding protein with PUA-like domain
MLRCLGAKEAWLSGLKQHTANVLAGKLARRFESFRLRRHYWLLKTEAGEFSVDDLKRVKKEPWSGVRNFQARNNMRAMQAGDLCFIYHTGDEKAVVGIGKVVGKPYADKDPMWALVDIAFVKKLKRPVTLAEIKNDPSLRGMILIRASRLSVQPVSEKQFDYIVRLGSAHI